MITVEQLFERFTGSALGAFMGDALGMPVEGWTAGDIERCYGRLDRLEPGRFPAGHYTDDTEMTIGLLESLVEAGGFDPAVTARCFLANYHPWRGYGGRIHGLMDLLRQGVCWDQVGTDSFGNGSAMRVAPAGFFFYDDLSRLKECAAGQAAITHRHPEALAGAVMQAGAVALALADGLKGQRRNRAAFLDEVSELGRSFDETSAGRLLGLKEMKPGPFRQMVREITSRYRCDIRAVEAVGPAVAAYLFTDNFEEAVVLAVNLGGDTDTIGAMAGAIAGAAYGMKGLPKSWLKVLENGPLGRDHVVDLCRRAAEIKAIKP
jgi:poly(ADP-ribose) glycohydrolase ARH3